ncbi:MAG: Fic family protein [Candidatus Gracilibacteria bacterium]|jgi:Fic family protein
MHKETKLLLQKIDTLNEKIKTFRPLKQGILEALQEKLRIEWTYNSNAIEGNTLTFGETAFFLREGLTSEGKPLKDYLEAKNHAEAIDGLYEIIQEKRKITEGLIKEIHFVLMRDVNFTYAQGARKSLIQKQMHAGTYKIQPNHVLTLSGKIHYYTDPLHVKDEMEKLIKQLNENKSLHPIELAAMFHHKFVQIHPFDDGNGRLARLLMNLIIMKNGYPPCIIRNQKRREYIKTLELADTKKDFSFFLNFVAEEFINTLEKILAILEQKTTVEYPETSNKIQREKIIMEALKEGPFAISQLVEITRIKRSTLKKDLHSLAKTKKIKTSGKGKGLLYNSK